MNETLRAQLEGSIALLDARLCINCRHYRAGTSAYFDLCARLAGASEDGVALVRGDGRQALTCHMERIGSPTESNCGAAGRFFEARE